MIVKTHDLDAPLKPARAVAVLKSIHGRHCRTLRTSISRSASSRWRHTHGSSSRDRGYALFGQTVVQTGPAAVSNLFRYSTKYLDEETGLYNFGWRYYHPDLGRWVNRDPIEEDGGPNAYSMTANDAIANIDADGRLITFSFSKDLNASGLTDSKGQKVRGRNVESHQFTVTCDFFFILRVNGSFSLKLELLAWTDAMWEVHFPRYDSKWGKPRSNFIERSATYAHETDHYLTFIDLSDIFKQLNAKDGEWSCSCSERAKKLTNNMTQIADEAVAHSFTFDLTAWWDGGNYSFHPFVPSIPLE